MKTPQDVFNAIPALRWQGLDPVRIAVRLVDISLENDEATRQIQTTHGYAGGLRTIELRFLVEGDVIYFDGAAWHFHPRRSTA
jgi:hypothetical protein